MIIQLLLLISSSLTVQASDSFSDASQKSTEDFLNSSSNDSKDTPSLEYEICKEGQSDCLKRNTGDKSIGNRLEFSQNFGNNRLLSIISSIHKAKPQELKDPYKDPQYPSTDSFTIQKSDDEKYFSVTLFQTPQYAENSFFKMTVGNKEAFFPENKTGFAQARSFLEEQKIPKESFQVIKDIYLNRYLDSKTKNKEEKSPKSISDRVKLFTFKNPPYISYKGIPDVQESHIQEILKSLDLFSDENLKKITIKNLQSNGGSSTLFLYQIRLDGKVIFYIKGNTSEDIGLLDRLEHSDFARDLKRQGIPHMPKFSFDEQLFYFEDSGKKHYFSVIHPASQKEEAKPIIDILDRGNPKEISQSCGELGKAMATSHVYHRQDKKKPFGADSYTLVHGDGHGNNTFYNSQAKDIRYIDLATLAAGSDTPAGFKRDCTTEKNPSKLPLCRAYEDWGYFGAIILMWLPNQKEKIRTCFKAFSDGYGDIASRKTPFNPYAQPFKLDLVKDPGIRYVSLFLKCAPEYGAQGKYESVCTDWQYACYQQFDSLKCQAFLTNLCTNYPKNDLCFPPDPEERRKKQEEDKKREAERQKRLAQLEREESKAYAAKTDYYKKQLDEILNSKPQNQLNKEPKKPEEVQNNNKKDNKGAEGLEGLEKKIDQKLKKLEEGKKPPVRYKDKVLNQYKEILKMNKVN